MMFDVYIYLTFFIVFKYFYKKRFQEEEEESIRSRFIGSWLMLLLIVNAYTSFNTYLKSMFMAIYGSYSQNKGFKTFTELDDILITPFFRFLTGISFLYLVFKQGCLRLEKELEGNKEKQGSSNLEVTFTSLIDSSD